MSKYVALLLKTTATPSFREVARIKQGKPNSRRPDFNQKIENLDKLIDYLPKLLKQTRMERSAATQIAFHGVLCAASQILNCSEGDIKTAYGLDDSFLQSIQIAPLRLANISQDKQIEILRDILKEAHETKKALQGKSRGFKTMLNDSINAPAYDDTAFHAMSQLRAICPAMK